MEKIYVKEEYIKLGQALKVVGLVENGVDAKDCIKTGLVKVNDEVCYERGKKLYKGDIVIFDGNKIEIDKK